MESNKLIIHANVPKRVSSWWKEWCALNAGLHCSRRGHWLGHGQLGWRRSEYAAMKGATLPPFHQWNVSIWLVEGNTQTAQTAHPKTANATCPGICLSDTKKLTVFFYFQKYIDHVKFHYFLKFFFKYQPSWLIELIFTQCVAYAKNYEPKAYKLEDSIWKNIWFMFLKSQKKKRFLKNRN